MNDEKLYCPKCRCEVKNWDTFWGICDVCLGFETKQEPTEPEDWELISEGGLCGDEDIRDEYQDEL